MYLSFKEWKILPYKNWRWKTGFPTIIIMILIDCCTVYSFFLRRIICLIANQCRLLIEILSVRHLVRIPKSTNNSWTCFHRILMSMQPFHVIESDLLNSCCAILCTVIFSWIYHQITRIVSHWRRWSEVSVKCWLSLDNCLILLNCRLLV